ncbi:mus81 structure-specific endonuclease subunit isoform X2 [Lasioglossum baleicum]|uniref:mus81 structure-specific endonuclease subunit isoform X2 n=1 Tax=Lasioglossum baleicum TaxID=434251 RepID=UPI003FCCA55C
MKRVKMKVKRPNPLFELWLEEWRQKASSQNSDMQYHFSKALASLKKYPLPLKSGKDCLILQHFGTKLCSLLDKKLEKYKAENGGLISTDDIICIHCNNIKEPKRKHKSQPVSITAENPTPKKTELAELSKCNLPSWNLENYAVLMILYKKTQEIYSSGFVVEEDLLLEVKNLCGNASKNSIMSFFDNGLVFRLSTPIRYTLTEAGINISKKICEITATDANLVISSDVLNNIQARLVALFPQKSEKADAKSCDNSGLNTQPSGEHRKNIPNSLTKSSQVENCRSPEKLTRNKRNVQQSSQCSTQKKSKGNDVIEIPDRLNDVNSDASNKENGRILSVDHVQKRIYLKSSKFDIILLVDTQETCGGKTKPQHDVTLSELSQFGVLFEVRHLKVGDFAWIARCRNTSNELILPYIVERKRIDDLSASITDGRFHEQKFRLKQCGIENLMYIIEEYDKGNRLAIPRSSLMQASINTLIQDGFSKKNLVGCKKETLPQADILVDTVNLMEFEEFNKAASKQKVFKVTQMFVRQLLQLKGVSVEKAFAIVERYPTPKVLVNAFQQSDCNGELLLSNVQAENKKQVLGPVISKTICQLYTNKTLS